MKSSVLNIVTIAAALVFIFAGSAQAQYPYISKDKKQPKRMETGENYYYLVDEGETKGGTWNYWRNYIISKVDEVRESNPSYERLLKKVGIDPECYWNNFADLAFEVIQQMPLSYIDEEAVALVFIGLATYLEEAGTENEVYQRLAACKGTYTTISGPSRYVCEFEEIGSMNVVNFVSYGEEYEYYFYPILLATVITPQDFQEMVNNGMETKYLGSPDNWDQSEYGFACSYLVYSMELDNYTIENFKVIVTDHYGKSLLGKDFIDLFSSYRINKATGTVEFWR